MTMFTMIEEMFTSIGRHQMARGGREFEINLDMRFE